MKLYQQTLNKVKWDWVMIGILFTISTLTTLSGFTSGEDFWTWAWTRHANLLSWLVRPLFFLPLAYYSYKRNVAGIVSVIIATATSMYWFPAPASVNPIAEQFLAVEQDYLRLNWTIAKILVSSVVPLIIALLINAFWKRSIKMGILIINLAAILKILWSVLVDEEGGILLIVFALLGLVACNCAIYIVTKKKLLKGD